MGILMGEMFQGNDSVNCHALPGLSKGQTRLCHLYNDHMAIVAVGAKQALQECKHLFQHRRWNCSLIEGASSFAPLLKLGKVNFI